MNVFIPSVYYIFPLSHFSLLSWSNYWSPVINILVVWDICCYRSKLPLRNLSHQKNKCFFFIITLGLCTFYILLPFQNIKYNEKNFYETKFPLLPFQWFRTSRYAFFLSFGLMDCCHMKNGAGMFSMFGKAW